MPGKQDTQSVFSEIPLSPLTHFRLHFYAAIYRVIFYIQQRSDVGGVDLDDIFTEFPFLGSYFTEMFSFMPEEIEWDQALAWWEKEIRAWERSQSIHLPLVSLEKELGIDFRKRLALVLVGLIEEDSRFGTLFEKIQAPLPYRQPCQEFIGQMLLDSPVEEMLRIWEIFQSLGDSGLLKISNKDSPRSEWLPRVPLPLWSIINGNSETQSMGWGTCYPSDSFSSIENLIYPDEFVQKLLQVPIMLAEGTTNVIILRGSQGSDSIQVFGAIARTLDLGVILLSKGSSAAEADWKVVGPFCIMQRVMPIFAYDPIPGETVETPNLGNYQGPVGIIMGHEGGLSGKLTERALTVRIPILSAGERFQRWEQAFAGHLVENLSETNQRYQLPGNYIRKVATLAISRARLENQSVVKSKHVQEACRSLNRQMLDMLATRLNVDGSWDQLIVSRSTRAKLHELEKHCFHRERLLDHLSPAYRMDSNRGVRALFSGNSGTGKTMAAKILTSMLGMDLYRVDLAAVINKYVGETEKNLHRVLTRAEELDVVLLLDEGDALLGNRTEVKSANDRFANLETNYLLQKLETYQGIILVTSNVSENIDRAFQRRMDVVVNFVPPKAEERLKIWKLHLPADHGVDRSYLDEISSRCAITGGQIHNAALFATLLSLDEEGPVQKYHLRRAIQREYQKAGAANPLENGYTMEDQKSDLLSFVNALD